MGRFRFRVFAAAFALGLVPSAPADAINIVLVYDDLGENPSYDSNGTRLMAIAAAAATIWERLIPSAGTHIVDVSWSNLEGSQLGLWKFDPFGNNNLYFDADSADWFFDPTPLGNGEFDFGDPLAFDNGPGSYLAGPDPSSLYFDGTDPPATLEIAYLGTGKSGDAATHTDLLSVILHEMGHELGVGGDILSGRYPLDPDHVLGRQGVEVVEGNCEGSGSFCEEHGHVAPPLALMSPNQPPGVRTLPSALDVLVAARDSNYEQVDLARKFSGRSGSWGDPSDWIGGRVPDDEDDVIIAHGGTTTVTGARSADSVWIARNSTLDATGDLAIDHELVVEGELVSSFGSEISAHSFETRPNSEVRLSGGHLVIGSGGGRVNGESFAADPQVVGRGILESNGLLEVLGTISAEGGDLRLSGTGAIRLEREIGNQFVPGLLRAVDGNLGLDIGFAAQSLGSIMVDAGHNVTALRTLSIPSGVEVLLLGDENAPAVLNSVGSGIQVTINDLDVGRNGQIFARDVRLQGHVGVSQAGNVLTLSSGLRTTLANVGVIGNGTVVQDSDISIQGSVNVFVDTFDWGNSTTSESHSLTIDPGAALRITSDSLGSSTGVFRGAMQIDSGVLNVETETGWSIPGASIFGAPRGSLAMIHSGAGDPVVQGTQLTLGGDLFVSGGNAFIEAPFATTAAAQVVLFGNSKLFLDGATTIDGGSFTGLGTLVQRGDITVTRDTTIATETFAWGNSLGLLRNHLTVDPGATLTVASAGTGDPDNDFRGGIVLNGGSLVVNTDSPWTLPASSLFLAGGGLTMDGSQGTPHLGGQALTLGGTIEVVGGEAHIDGELAMLDGSIDVAAGATLNLNGANTYRGTFTGDGVYRHNGSALLGSTPLAIPNLVQNGRLTALGVGGAESLLDTRTLDFAAGSDTRLFGDLRIRGDAKIEPDAGFSGDGTLIVDAAATLQGGGDVAVNLRNEGTLSPGSSPGSLHVGGNLAQLGTLSIELGGTRRGVTYDVLAVDGLLTLDGTLELILYGGFQPTAGERFDILDWSGRLAGAFDAFVYPIGSGPTEWDFSALYTTGELRFVPEPGTAVLLGLGLAALRVRRPA